MAQSNIDDARALQQVARNHVIPLVRSLRGNQGGDMQPWIDANCLTQGYVNLLLVQLYHLVEQQVSALLGSGREESKYDFTRDKLLQEFFDATDIDLTMLDSWEGIEELRLMANTVKHSDAQDSRKLRTKRPEFFRGWGIPALDKAMPPLPSVMPILGLYFQPSEAEYDAKVDGVETFWQEVAAVAKGSKVLPTVGEKLRERRPEVLRIAEQHGASNVRIFGSVARGDAGPASDIDFLVDFAPGTSFGEEVKLVEELEELLGRKVDLGSPDALNSGKKKRVLSEAIPL